MHHWKRATLALGFGLASVFAIACDGDDDDLDNGIPGVDSTLEPGNGNDTDDGDDSGNGNGLPANGELVAITDDGELSISVVAGSTVTFVNESDEVATITIDGNDESGDLEPGDSYEHTFDEPGEYMVTSANHPGFRAMVSVA